MPQYPKANGAIFTVSGVTGNDRWQVVSPWIRETAPDALDTFETFSNWFENMLIPAWQDCLAADSAIIGMGIQPATPGAFLPGRKNYPITQYPGLVSGQSCPQNGSLLGAFYSTDQAGSGQRVRVGKSNFGPAPEANQSAGKLTAGAVTLLNTLMSTILTGIGGAGTKWLRALSLDDFGGAGVYSADQGFPRNLVSTQKRRMLPQF